VPGHPDLRCAGHDLGWLAGAIESNIHDPFALYARQQNTSIAEVAQALELTGALADHCSLSGKEP
jgi:hypothetical protein